MKRRLLGLDPGETMGLALIELDGWDLASAAVVGTSRVRAPTSTKLVPEERVQLERLFRDKLAAEVRHFEADLVVIECPIDARASWSRQKGGRRESPETRFGQGLNFGTAVHAVPFGIPVVSYPVRGRKGVPGWYGNRTARVVEFQMRAFLRTYGSAALAEAASEHELMATGLLLHHIQRAGLNAFRDAALAQGR